MSELTPVNSVCFLWSSFSTIFVFFSHFESTNSEKVGVYSFRFTTFLVLWISRVFSQFLGAKPDLGSKSLGVAPLSSKNWEFFLTVYSSYKTSPFLSKWSSIPPKQVTNHKNIAAHKKSAQSEQNWPFYPLVTFLRHIRWSNIKTDPKSGIGFLKSLHAKIKPPLLKTVENALKWLLPAFFWCPPFNPNQTRTGRSL